MYKRQHPHGASDSGRESIRTVPTGKGTVHAFRKSTSQEKPSGTVSYTHLDVYKRQGHEEISLSSLSSSDYSELKELVNFLIEEFHGNAVNISLPSLRIDAFALDVMSKVQDIKKSSLTFAPEAGSQRLRDVINKGLTLSLIHI